MSNDVPAGWPRISSAVFYDDASAAIDWLGRAFGFVTRLKVEGDDGSIVHSELEYRDGLIMVGSTGRGAENKKSPRSIGGANTQSLFLYVGDIEAHYTRAKAAGATIVSELETKNYGDEHGVDRGYAAEDCEGHHWWFAQRMSGPKKPA